MNVQRYVIGSIVVFVFLLAAELVFHRFILGGCYGDYTPLIRTGFLSSWYAIWLFLGYLIFSFGFCFIFTRGYENKGIGEGIRYGLYIAFAFAVSSILIGYAVCLIPVNLVLSWIVGYSVIMILAGIIIAAIYRKQQP
ncbi:MAG: hypothetical protein ABII79_13675 [bacterium]